MLHTATTTWQQAEGLFTSVSVDWIIIGVFALVVVIVSLRMGTQIAAALAFATPVAVLVYNALPSTAYLSSITSQASAGMPAAAVFVVLFVVFFFITYRVVGSYGMMGAFPVQATLGGLAAAIIVLVFWLQIPALAALWHFGPQVQAVFTEKYRLFWLVAAYLALASARK